MDNFSNPTVSTVGPAATKNINLLGGDYGVDGAATKIAFVKNNGINQGYVAITPTVAGNYFYARVNPEACYDLSKYQAIQFAIQAVDPVSTATSTYDSNLSITQKAADCITVPASILKI